MTQTVIEASSGPVTVRTTLYGEVDDARLARERTLTRRRAGQLDVRAQPQVRYARRDDSEYDA